MAEERLAGEQQTRKEAEATLANMREQNIGIEQALANLKKKSSEAVETLLAMEKRKNEAEEALGDAKQAHQQTAKVTALPCHHLIPFAYFRSGSFTCCLECNMREELSTISIQWSSILKMFAGAIFWQHQ